VEDSQVKCLDCPSTAIPSGWGENILPSCQFAAWAPVRGSRMNAIMTLQILFCAGHYIGLPHHRNCELFFNITAMSSAAMCCAAGHVTNLWQEKHINPHRRPPSALYSSLVFTAFFSRAFRLRARLAAPSSSRHPPSTSPSQSPTLHPRVKTTFESNKGLPSRAPSPLLLRIYSAYFGIHKTPASKCALSGTPSFPAHTKHS